LIDSTEHQDLTLKEIRLTNEEYFAKAQDSSDKYLKILDEMSKYKREQASVESIKADRDQRIKENRNTIEDLERLVNRTNKKNLRLEAELTTLTSDHKQLSSDYKITSQ
jgi:chromosome segregation ATPase